MKKIIVTTLFCFLSIYNLLGQNADDVKYRFAKEVFEKDYKESNFEKFSGKIDQLNETTIRFDDKVLEIYNIDAKLKAIFLSGLFYPNIFAGVHTTKTKIKSELDTMSTNQKVLYNLMRNDSLTIGHFEQIEVLNPNPQTKRFVFWLYRKNTMNPIECYLELQNKKATNKISIEDFIEGAKLTFYYQGTIII